MLQALWELLTSQTDLTVFEVSGIVVGMFVLGFFVCAGAQALVEPKEYR